MIGLTEPIIVSYLEAWSHYWKHPSGNLGILGNSNIIHSFHPFHQSPAYMLLKVVVMQSDYNYACRRAQLFHVF